MTLNLYPAFFGFLHEIIFHQGFLVTIRVDDLFIGNHVDKAVLMNLEFAYMLFLFDVPDADLRVNTSA